jgi:hypothetical protein
LITFIITQGKDELIAVTVAIFIPLFYLLFVFKDSLFKNASIGKKIMHIKVISLKGKFGFKAMLIRGSTFLMMAIELLLIILENKRIGDVWAKTAVVEDI